jgi:phage FluMu gp28-like protein
MSAAGYQLQKSMLTVSADDAPPPVLLVYQQRWVSDPAALKVAEKSRRIGLTWGEAADDALIAASAEGSNVFYISATQDMALEYIEACALWARAYDLAASAMAEGIFIDEDGREIKTYRIDFPRAGHRIVALSSRPANLRGKQGVVVIDEAAFAPDLPGLIKAALAMLMWGDKVRIISTHNGDSNPFNELINEIRADKRTGSVHRITFADAVADGLFRRVCLRSKRPWSLEAEAEWVATVRKTYGDDAGEELDVVPNQSGGAFIPLSMIETRMAGVGEVPIVRRRWKPDFALVREPLRHVEVEGFCREVLDPLLLQLDKSRPHGFGQDFARVGDLTVITILEESSTLINRPVLVVELACCPYKQQEQILSFICDRLPRLRGGALDANGNGGQIAEFAADKYGHRRIEQVHLTEKFYIEEMPRFKAHLEDASLDGLPRDDQCRDDLRAIEKINGVPKISKPKTQKADGEKLQRHGDFAISLFLADYAMRRETAPACDGLISLPRHGLARSDDPDLADFLDDNADTYSRRMF